MYQVTVQTFNKKRKEMVDQITISMGSMEDAEFDEGMHRLSELLFGLDMDFDADEDGDIVIDDMLISASENEPFEKSLIGNKHTYKVVGKDTNE